MTGNPRKISIVAGARPNFMKIAPIIRALDARPADFAWRLVHTGQHYDAEMSDVFFDELGIPRPHAFFDAGGGSHAQQTAKIMVKYEEVCEAERPDVALVVGDVNSTLACSIVAKKMGVAVAHVEAGLRSGDMTMPEEVNRIVTDSISDYFFVTEPSGVDNLLREGHTRESIHFVGHVMIDNLFYQVDRLARLDAVALPSAGLKARLGRYGVVTLHRPSNVDSEDSLRNIVSALSEVGRELPLVFAAHPRTQRNLERFGIDLPDTIIKTPPLAYMDFLNLWKDAAVVLTDSGGLQEETTALGVPCVTLRLNTERPVTVSHGSNVLAGTDPERIVALTRGVLTRERGGKPPRPELWDGNAAERIAEILARG